MKNNESSMTYSISEGTDLRICFWESSSSTSHQNERQRFCSIQPQYYDPEKEEWVAAPGFKTADLLTLSTIAKNLYDRFTRNDRQAEEAKNQLS